MLFGACFFLVGVLSLYWAYWLGGWAWLLLWPGACYLALAAAYFGLGPGVFGKRPDGTTSLAATIFLAPYLVPYWIGYVFVIWWTRHIRGEEDCHELIPGVWVARRLQPGEYPVEVERVVDLTCEYAEPPAIVSRVDYRSFPILDGHVPPLGPLVQLIDEMEVDPKPTLIHCAIGHGRTGLIAVALLLRRGLAKDVEEAIRMAQAVRFGIRLNGTQREVARQFAASLGENRRSDTMETSA